MTQVNYGVCKFCGANNVKSPKTGKIFCSDKCWLKKPDDTGSYAPAPKKESPNWDEINARKEEGMEWLNAKNNAALIVGAAIRSGQLSYENWENEYKGVAEKIFNFQEAGL